MANGRGSTARRSAALMAKRRAALVIRLLKGERTAAEAARRHGLKVAEVEVARSLSARGGERTSCPAEGRRSAAREEINRLKRVEGE